MVSHYRQHLMTPKLLGSIGFMAFVITRLVPCPALPCTAAAKPWSASPSVTFVLGSRGSATCGYGACQQLEGTGVRLHFCTLPQQKWFSSQQNNSTENCGPSQVNGAPGDKERCREREEFCWGGRRCTHRVEEFSMPHLLLESTHKMKSPIGQVN